MYVSRKRIIGLSMGTQRAAAAEIHINTAGFVEVDHLGVINIPANTIAKGDIIDPKSALQSLKEVLSVSNISGSKRISLSIEDDLTITRLMTMPSMSKHEMQESLMNEVEDYAVLSRGTPVLDFQVVKQTIEGEVERMDVLFVVATDELVNSYSSVIRSANLKLISIETMPLAILRAFINVIQSELHPDKPIMLVIIEENRGMIIILQDNTVRFVHDIVIGSKEIQSDNDVRELHSEIVSSLDYFKNKISNEDSVEDIVLFTDSLEGLDIGELLRVRNLPIIEPQLPVRMIERFEKEIKGNILSVCAAIGSALHATTGKGEIAINLMPYKKEIPKSGLRAKVGILSVVLVSVIFIFIAASAILRSVTNSIEKNLVELKQQETLSVSTQPKTTDIENSISQLKARIEVTETAMKSIKWANCARLFQEIRAIVPGTLWLTDLRWKDDGNIVISGCALSYDSVFQFRRALMASPYFDPVKLAFIRSTEMSGRPIEQYEIQCGVKKEIMEEGAKNDGTG